MGAVNPPDTEHLFVTGSAPTVGGRARRRAMTPGEQAAERVAGQLNPTGAPAGVLPTSGVGTQLPAAPGASEGPRPVLGSPLGPETAVKRRVRQVLGYAGTFLTGPRGVQL